jgi:hypothetical protein
MGNGVFLKMIGCCNKENNIEKAEIYVIKTIPENNQYIDKNNSHIIKKKETHNKNEKMIPTKSRLSSGSVSLVKTKQVYMGENSSTNNNINVSISNNTLQMNNSTLFKNNLVYNNLNGNMNYLNVNPIDELRHKNSIINFNKYNSSLKDNSFIIKTKLILSGELFSNKSVEIDKYGMKNGLRQKHDGLTIFGLKENSDNPNIHTSDYYFPDIEKIDENNNQKITGKVFEIYLNKIDKMYTLYYLHNTLILYYKIKNSVLFNLDKDYFLILGDIFITVLAKRNDSNLEEKVIYIQAELENEKPKKFIFSQKDMPIRIGRVNCQIEIKKPSISKLHSIIDYKNDNFYYKDCGSTNGSTLLIREDDTLKIKGEMSLKLEEISFKISEVDDDNYITEENI